VRIEQWLCNAGNTIKKNEIEVTAGGEQPERALSLW